MFFISLSLYTCSLVYMYILRPAVQHGQIKNIATIADYIIKSTSIGFSSSLLSGLKFIVNKYFRYI